MRTLKKETLKKVRIREFYTSFQAKLQKIQESSPPSDEGIIPHEAAGSQANYNSSDFTKNTLDASLSEDTYASIMKRTPSPRLGRSPVSKDVKMETSRRDGDDDDEDYGSGSPLPVQSHSPTLRRWKLNSSTKGGAEHSGIDKSRSGLVGTDGMSQPMASQVSPRGMGTMSRLSIHASKVKEIPKNDPRLSDVSCEVFTCDIGLRLTWESHCSFVFLK